MKISLKILIIFSFILLLSACNKSEIKVYINGDEKIVNKEFIKIITKNEGVTKIAVLENEKVYDIKYKNSDYFIYNSKENHVILVDSPEKNTFYPISNEELQLIEEFAK